MQTKESKQKETFLTRLRRSFLHVNSDKQTDSRIRQTYQSLSHWHDFQIKLFWEGIVVGIFSGLVISFFRWALTQAEMLRILLYDYLTGRPDWYTGAWFAVLFAVAYVLYVLTKHEPMAGAPAFPRSRASFWASCGSTGSASCT